MLIFYAGTVPKSRLKNKISRLLGISGFTLGRNYRIIEGQENGEGTDEEGV